MQTDRKKVGIGDCAQALAVGGGMYYNTLDSWQYYCISHKENRQMT